MTLEVHPVDMKCNLKCTYCYENPMRDAGNELGEPYNLEAIKEALTKQNTKFTLFGGEPLLMPLKDLEDLFIFGFERYKENSIQSNGILITPEHIRVFKKYNVHVGISIDGPEELNSPRTVGNDAATLALTKKVMSNIDSLLDEGITPSLIITIHNANVGTDELLERFLDWLMLLDDKGIYSARIHLLEVENEEVRKTLQLSNEACIKALNAILDLSLSGLRIDMFDEMRRMLDGNTDNVTCVWNACDPYTTSAVQGIDRAGSLTNCGRTFKDGVPFRKANVAGRERQVILFNTPYADGGCKGCRFFFACKGYCPGTAIDGDWRNRSEHCEVLIAMFTRFEREIESEGRIPLSTFGGGQKLVDIFIPAKTTAGSKHVDTPHLDHTDVNKMRVVVPVVQK